MLELRGSYNRWRGSKPSIVLGNLKREASIPPWVSQVKS